MKLETEEGLGIDEDLETEVESLGEEAETRRKRRFKFVGFKEPFSVSGQPRISSHDKRSSLKSSNSTSITKIKEKNTLPKKIGLVSVASQAPVGPDVGATKDTKATSAPPLNKDKWLKNYCEIFGPKEDMDDDKQAKIINAWIKAKKAAATT